MKKKSITLMSKIQDWINKRSVTQRIILCAICMGTVCHFFDFIKEKMTEVTPKKNFKTIEDIEKKIESIETQINDINQILEK